MNISRINTLRAKASSCSIQKNIPAGVMWVNDTKVERSLECTPI
jgi:hypothetical protein